MTRKTNYIWMLQNWQFVASKLCEEVTVHDMLDVFIAHVETSCMQLDRAKMNAENHKLALHKLKEAQSLLDPEPS